MYFVDPTTGAVRKILGNIPGLSAFSDPDGLQVIYLEQTDSAKLSVLDRKTGGSRSLTPATFPEKCTWSKKDKNIVYCAVPREFLDGLALTAWYKGYISYTDDIWKYDIKNNTSVILENLPNDAGNQIDLIKPILSENEQYLIFINKIDNSLWSLDLSK